MRRNVLGISIVVVAVGIAWLSWAWSPTPEPAPSSEPEPDTGVQAPAARPAPPAASPPPPTAAAKVAPQQQPAPTQSPQPPEHIPSPHPMSLDQARPPEAYGPLAEYKQRYASESRGPESSANEQKFRSRFDVPNIPPILIQDVSCRRSMCKLALSWTPERRLGFVVILESSKNLFDKRVAVEPGTHEADGSYLTNLYIRLSQDQ